MDQYLIIMSDADDYILKCIFLIYIDTHVYRITLRTNYIIIIINNTELITRLGHLKD